MTDSSIAIAPDLTLGQRLRVARQRTGMTLRDVADATGMSHAAVANYERDEQEPTATRLARLARLYDVDIRWLVLDLDADLRPWWDQAPPLSGTPSTTRLRRAMPDCLALGRHDHCASPCAA